MSWAASQRGKRGGARIIYYFANAAGRILLLDIYAKNEKENLTAVEIEHLSSAVNYWLDELKDSRRFTADTRNANSKNKADNKKLRNNFCCLLGNG